MDLGALLLVLAVLVAVGFSLAAPLMRGARPTALDEAPEVSALLAERDRVITALQELDFDFKVGKVPEQAYPEQRASLIQRGVEILRQIDELAPESSATGGDAGARIEQAAAAGDGTSGAHDPLADDKIESMLAARRAARHSKSAGFCPRCGKPVLTSDSFCPNCGKSLQ